MAITGLEKTSVVEEKGLTVNSYSFDLLGEGFASLQETYARLQNVDTFSAAGSFDSSSFMSTFSNGIPANGTTNDKTFGGLDQFDEEEADGDSIEGSIQPDPELWDEGAPETNGAHFEEHALGPPARSPPEPNGISLGELTKPDLSLHHTGTVDPSRRRTNGKINGAVESDAESILQAPKIRTAIESIGMAPVRKRGRHKNSSKKSKKQKSNSMKVSKDDSINAYINSLCNHDLLNKNEEVILGREIQTLKKLEETREYLEVKLKRPPTYAEWAAAARSDMTVAELKRQIRRSLRAKSALAESNIRLVVSIAKRYVRFAKNISLQDLSQEGILGLNKACERFDPERGFRFSTYATWWIKHGILKALSGGYELIRMPAYMTNQVRNMRKTEAQLTDELGRAPTLEEIAERLDKSTRGVERVKQISKRTMVSMDQTITSPGMKGSAAEGTGGGSPGDNDGALTIGDTTADENQDVSKKLAAKSKRLQLSRLLRTLSEREQAVIRLRYGLDDGHIKTLDDVGGRFGVTRERVRQIEQRALSKLRQPYRNFGIRSFVGSGAGAGLGVGLGAGASASTGAGAGLGVGTGASAGAS
eukprot:CAMPEP_0116830200 /NCGR_PEP_ID=MMETSP0418-20121206/4634_1 /TAXON_ID=1158023 /ORGANISM="Astrosyne radiata, Strain 13vi08-1A" /LENGTH=589 /DNA_ID=CAMNT_0004459283 /DNA_START=183 /DNA_END=1955 /DNA_ORIENTATION=+